MRRLCLGLILVLALVKPNYVQASIHSDVNTAKNFIDASWKMSDTIEKAAAFAKQLKFLGGALGVLGTIAGIFGTNLDSARHRQVMDEFAKVHNGIAKLEKQISFLEVNMELQHMNTRLFDTFEVLRKATRLSSLGLRAEMLTYCNHTNLCIHALEQLARHAPELLEAYIKNIGFEEDYVTLVAAYAHQLVSVVGNSATIVGLSLQDVDQAYIGLEEMSSKIGGVLERSKWRWSNIYANIKLDARALMKQGRHDSTLDVLRTLYRKLRPKFPWMSLGILVYNDIWSKKKHWITGNYAHVFHESGKNVVVFVKNKSYDSFQGGRIEKPRCIPWLFGLLAGLKKETGVDGTARIKRYEGLWTSFPSDYNYCLVNYKHETWISIKMYP